MDIDVGVVVGKELNVPADMGGNGEEEGGENGGTGAEAEAESGGADKEWASLRWDS